MTSTPERQTLAQLPLPDLLYRLAEHVPDLMGRSTPPSLYQCAWSKGDSDIQVWPRQPNHCSAITGEKSIQFAHDLLGWAEAQGWEMQLGYTNHFWQAHLFIPPSLGWLTAVGEPQQHPRPLLQAVAGVLLMGVDMKNGGDGFIQE